MWRIRRAQHLIQHFTKTLKLLPKAPREFKPILLAETWLHLFNPWLLLAASNSNPAIQSVDGFANSVSIASSGGSTTHTQALQDMGSDTDILNHSMYKEPVGKGDCVGEV